MFLNHIPKKKLLLAFGDSLLFSFAYFLAPILRSGGSVPVLGDKVAELLPVVAIYLYSFYLFDLYDKDWEASGASYLFRLSAAISTAAGFCIITSFFLRTFASGRSHFLITAALAALFASSWRALLSGLLRCHCGGRKSMLIVGAGAAGSALCQALGNSAHRVIGFIEDDPKKVTPSYSLQVLGRSAALEEIVAHHQADEIALAITRLEDSDKNGLLRGLVECKMRGVEVYLMPALYEEVTGKIPVTYVNDAWFINTTISGTKKSIYNRKAKRLLDILFSFGALLFWGLPLLLPVCIAIKLDSRGPIFYKQRRTGANGVVFDLVKLRSMRVDAEQNGAVWATEEDPRITRVGRIIRKLRIDELPQIWNVLKGDVSFIGPRPERPEFVKMLERKIPYYALRHAVKPGITGWAQVNYRYGASEADALEKLQYDLYYIKNLSAFLDFCILLRTVKVVLFQRGAR